MTDRKYEYIQKKFEMYPKIELHAHLNGSLSSETLRELSSLQGGREGDSLNRFIHLHQNGSLSECFEVFKIAHSLTGTPNFVRIATERVIQEFHADNVVYLELRSTLRAEELMSKRQYLEAIINGIENTKATCPNILVKMIVSIDRSKSVENGIENIEIAHEYQKLYPDLIVGLDLSGDPTKGDIENFVPLFQLGKKYGFKWTIHCGEVKNVKEISQILELKPDRIGHGTCIHPKNGGSVDVWNMLIQQCTPVEVCLTSNIACKTIDKLENHHLQFLAEKDHPFILSTDDKGVFSTTLSNEFYLAYKHLNLGDKLWQVSQNAIPFTFCKDEEKKRLVSIFNEYNSLHI